jgi:hypothetical protein
MCFFQINHALFSQDMQVSLQLILSLVQAVGLEITPAWLICIVLRRDVAAGCLFIVRQQDGVVIGSNIR